MLLSFLNVITVTIPELILNLFLGMLVVGNKRFLRINYINVLRFVMTILLMCLFSYYARIYVNIIFLRLIVVSIFNVLLFMIIYRIVWYKSLLSVIFYTSVLVISENLYAIPFYVYFDKIGNNFLKSVFGYFVLSLPQRIFQIYLVVHIMSLNVILINLNKIRRIRNESLIILAMLVFLQSVLMFVFVYSLSNSILSYALALCNLIVISCDLVFYRLIIRIAKTVKIEILKRYEKYNVFEVMFKLKNKDAGDNDNDMDDVV